MGNISSKVGKAYNQSIDTLKARYNDACTLSDLVNGNDISAAARDADRSRGAFPVLKEDEYLTFKSADELVIFPRRWGQGKTPTLTTLGFSHRLNRYIEIPASLFCKLSTQDEENSSLYEDDNLFGQSLLPRMNDSERLAKVAGKTLRVSKVMKLKTAGFTLGDDGKWRINEFDPDKCDTLKVYLFEDVTDKITISVEE